MVIPLDSVVLRATEPRRGKTPLATDARRIGKSGNAEPARLCRSLRVYALQGALHTIQWTDHS